MKTLFAFDLHPIRKSPFCYEWIQKEYLDLLYRYRRVPGAWGEIEPNLLLSKCEPSHGDDGIVTLPYGMRKELMRLCTPWGTEAKRVWADLMRGEGRISQLYFDILEYIHRRYGFDNYVYWGTNGAIRKFAESAGVRSMSLGLGVTRYPWESRYCDFDGGNGDAYSQKLDLSCFDPLDLERWNAEQMKGASSVPGFAPLASRHAGEILRHDSPTAVIALQLDDDSNCIAHSDFSGMEQMVRSVVPQLVAAGWEVLVKPHPGAVLERCIDQDTLCNYLAHEACRKFITEEFPDRTIWLDDIKPECYRTFLSSVDAVICVNSSVGFEAMLMGKPVVALGRAPYNIGSPLGIDDLCNGYDRDKYDDKARRIANLMLNYYLYPKKDMQNPRLLSAAMMRTVKLADADRKGPAALTEAVLANPVSVECCRGEMRQRRKTELLEAEIVNLKVDLLVAERDKILATAESDTLRRHVDGQEKMAGSGQETGDGSVAGALNDRSAGCPSGLKHGVRSSAILKLMRNRNSRVCVLCTRHTEFVAKLLARSLRSVYPQVEILSEEPNEYQDQLYFVVCPNVPRKLPRNYVAFQMEQTISDKWLTSGYIQRLEDAIAVLDYSRVNLRYWCGALALSGGVFYLPIDFLPGMRWKDGAYEYDVVFYGEVRNGRRRKILEELGRTYRIKLLFGVFGEQLYRELAKAKIIVNIHYFENALLETTRIYEAMSLGRSVVISETSADKEEERRLSGIVDFVYEGDSEGLKDRIGYWLSDEVRRQRKVEADHRLMSTRANAFEFFFNRFLLAWGVIGFEEFYARSADFVTLEKDGGIHDALLVPEYQRSRLMSGVLACRFYLRKAFAVGVSADVVIKRLYELVAGKRKDDGRCAMSNVDVSFVIPVYGTEDFLLRCLESVAAQDYPHDRIQIVVVDDCSPAGTAREIVTAFASGHPDIDVAFSRHGRNSSLYQARRTGVLKARGRYVFSLDSDDEVAPDLCRRMLETALRDDLDIVRCRMMELRPDGDRRPDLFTVMDCTSGEQLRGHFLEKRVHWPMCGKLIRTELYRSALSDLDAVLPPGAYVNSMEDLLQFFPMVFHASSYRSLDYFGYLYHLVPTSLSHGITMSEQRWNGLCDNVAQVRRTVLVLANKCGFTGAELFKAEDLFSATAVNVVRNEAMKFSPSVRGGRIAKWLSVFNFSVVICPLLYAFGEGDGWRLMSEAGIFGRAIRRTRSLSVAVVSGRYRMGGTERVVSRLLDIWRRYMPELELHLVTFDPPEDDDYPLPEGVKRVRIDSRDPDSQFRFIEYLRRMDVDTVVSANVSNWSCNRFAACAKLLGCRTIGMMHGSFAYFMTFAGGENDSRRYRLSAYDHITCVSEFNAAVFRALGMPSCVFVRNPLPYRETIDAVPVKTDKIVLYVGRFSVEKQPESIVRMFARVRARVADARLMLVGEAEHGQEWLCDRMRALCVSLGLEKAVEFVGSKTDVRPYYGRASVLVMASRYEGAPVVLAEAKQNGVPAVIMDLPYLDGIGEENGCVVTPYGDEEAMATAVSDILLDPTHHQRLADAALQCAKNMSDDHLVCSWRRLWGMDGGKSPVDSRLSQDSEVILTSLSRLIGEYIGDRDAAAAVERAALNSSVGRAVGRADAALAEAERLRNSRAYRIGRAVTWPYRMVRNTCRCYRDNGLRYTLSRIPAKFVNLSRRFFG